MTGLACGFNFYANSIECQDVESQGKKNEGTWKCLNKEGKEAWAMASLILIPRMTSYVETTLVRVSGTDNQGVGEPLTAMRIQ